jgi:aerobic-type carbon monoxide dehydrogenase small subunit (CoxS/CutS family)
VGGQWFNLFSTLISREKRMKTDTLTVHREKKSTYNCITILKDCKGKTVKVITGYNQPKKSLKTVVIRGKTYNLDFSNC